MQMKAEGMTQFDIFHVFVENSVNSGLSFLSSTQTNQNLKFIPKCLCLSSFKNKFQWTQKNVWPLNYKSSWSKQSTPIQPRGVIGAPFPYYVFKRCNSWECSVHFYRGPCLSDLEPMSLLLGKSHYKFMARRPWTAKEIWSVSKYGDIFFGHDCSVDIG